MANTVRHKTRPAGVDQPGFAGITPSLYAEEHAFSGGAVGSVLVRDTGTSDGGNWVAAAAGVLQATGVGVLPTFSGTLLNAIQDNITRTGTLVSGATGAGFTIALSTSTITGLLATARGGTNLDTSASTGAAQVSAGTWSVSTTLQTAIQNNITRTGTLVAGATGAGFTIALSTSTVTGLLGTARGGTNLDTSASTGVAQVAAGAWSVTTTLQSAVQLNSTLMGNGGTQMLSIPDTSTVRLGGGSTNGMFRVDTANTMVFQPGSSGYIFRNNANNASIMTLTDAGLLSAVGVGRHTFGGGGTSANSSIRINGGDASTFGPFLTFAKNGTDNSFIGAASGILGSGTSSDFIIFTNSTLGIGFYTNGSSSRTWGINAAGDFTFGVSSHIALSNGTPTAGTNAGNGTFTGTDYGFTFTAGTTTTYPFTINFGHTFSAAPAVSVNAFPASGHGVPNRITYAVTTTTVQVDRVDTVGMGTGTIYYFVVMGS